MMLTSTDLQTFITEYGLSATILHLAEETATVPDAARVLGVLPEQIIKSLVFLVREKPVLAIANGTHRVDARRLATRFGVGRKRVKLASAERALAITGYPVGAMPPFGHKTPLPTFVDLPVMALPLLYGGGGDRHAMLRLTPAELLAATGAEVLSLT